MAYRYSVDLRKAKGPAGRILVYKDRRIASRRNLELMYEVSTILMQSADIQAICERIMDSLFRCLKRIDHGSILWMEEDTSQVREIIAKSRPEGRGSKMTYSRTLVRQVIVEGRAVMISDTRDEEKVDLSDSIEMMQVKSVMCVPLICKSRIRGAIYVHSVNVPNGFRKEDLFLLIGLSAPAALAIENAFLNKKRKEEEGLPQDRKSMAVQTLAGGIAHGFNNLMMVIQGNASLMLLDVDKNNPHHQNLRKIESAVSRGNELTENLLAYSRLQTYQVEPIRPDLILVELIEECSNAPKGIHIRCRFEEQAWDIAVETLSFRRALKNVLKNAFESMPEGGEVYVETENVAINESFLKPRDARAGNYVKISITDTGVGMDAKTLEYIFDPFFTTKTMQTGTGLSLAATHGIIRNHGGFLKVLSAKGRGTTFGIYLPGFMPRKPTRKGIALGNLKQLRRKGGRLVPQAESETPEDIGKEEV